MSLKHEIRALYEKDRIKSPYGYSCFFDEGITRKIAYLSFLNPNVFNTFPWKVYDVKSNITRIKLLQLLQTPVNISDLGSLLVLCSDKNDTVSDITLALLKASIMYSCRLNFVDYEYLTDIDEEKIKLRTGIPDNQKIVAVILLGFFTSSQSLNIARTYEDIVMEL